MTIRENKLVLIENKDCFRPSW